jgi:crotonobetaine/carnitine-CoA ligase
MRDAIRRRGENISAAVIEQEALAVPGVAEAVAVAVPDEISGHEILLVVQVAESVEAANHERLLEHLRGRLPGFMVPRYLRFVDDLPRSISGKVRRDVLREHGLRAPIIDRLRDS